MRAVKSVWYRPAYGYAAAAVCVALAAWGAASPPPTLGIMRALDRTDLDTQLPLERLAIEAGSPATRSASPESAQQSYAGMPHPSVRPLPRPASHRLPRLCAQPGRPGRHAGSAPRSRVSQAASRPGGSGAARPALVETGYVQTINDWKNWT